MQHLHLNTRFINQFRFNHIIFPCSPEKKYRQYRFRQFTGRKNDIVLLGKYFVENPTDAAVVAQLAKQLEKEYGASYTLLARYAQNLEKLLLARIRKEPLTSICCSRLLSVVQPFLRLINSFHDKAQKELLKNLKVILANKTYPVDTSSHEVDDIMEVTGQYTDALLNYNDTFNSFLYNESQNTCGVAVTTHIEQHLLQLTTLLEKLLLAIESTQRSFKSWKRQLARKEKQELYN